MKDLNKNIHTPLGDNTEKFELDEEALENITSFFELLIGVDREIERKRGKNAWYS